uniref:Uncharacterized protein n=1 Tax=Oryza glumipatula TaxID=40148 RepID=A0A0E0BR43_9ORYZ
MGDCGREARRRWIRPPLCATAGWIRRDCGCSGDGRLRGGRHGGGAAVDPATAACSSHGSFIVLLTMTDGQQMEFI